MPFTDRTGLFRIIFKIILQFLPSWAYLHSENVNLNKLFF
jgi:hypothetical protein